MLMLGIVLGLLSAIGVSNVVFKISKPYAEHADQMRRVQRNVTGFITILLTTLIDIVFLVFNQLLSYRVIIGLAFIPLCIAFYSEPMTVIRFLDRSYNILYTGVFMPLKIVLNLVRYLFDLLIGIWNFIVESYNSVWDVLAYTILEKDPAKLKVAFVDISTGLAQLILALMNYIVNVLVAFMRNASADEVTTLTVFTKSYQNARELIQQGLETLADILSDICQGYATIDFTSIFLTITKFAFADSPVYDFIGQVIEAVLAPFKIIYLFVFHTLPIWARAAEGHTETAIVHYDVVLAPLADMHVSIGRLLDYTLHIISNMASCYFTKSIDIVGQTKCVRHDEHGLLSLPEAGYWTAVLYYYQIAQRIIHYCIHVIMNWHIIGLDISLLHQKLKFDLMLPHDLYRSASIGIKSIRDLVATIKVLGPFVSAIEDGARGLLLLAVFVMYTITTLLMGQNIPMCPGVPGVDALNSSYCLCNMPTFNYDSHALPFVQPALLLNDTHQTLYMCPALTSAKNYTPAEFQRELEEMPPCERADMSEDFPPYKVKRANCVCHPNRDASSPTGYCKCGTPLCDCTLPFKHGSDTFCNFRPEDIKLPQHTTLKSNDLINVCADIYGTESAARIGDINCLCATTLEPPHEASPVGSGMYYCPTLCDSRLEEFVYMKNKTVQTSSADIISYDMVYGCQSNTDESNCIYKDQNSMLPAQFYRQMYAQELFDSYSSQQLYMNYEEQCMCRINTYDIQSQLRLYPYAGDAIPTTAFFTIPSTKIGNYNYGPIGTDKELAIGVLRRESEQFVVPVDSWSHCNCPSFSQFAYGPLARNTAPGGTPFFESDVIMRYETYTPMGSITSPINLTVSMPKCNVPTTCPVDTSFVNPFSTDASTRLLFLQDGPRKINVMTSKSDYFTNGTGIMPHVLCQCPNSWPPLLISDVLLTGVPFHFYSLEDRLLCATSMPNVVGGKQQSLYSVSVQDIELNHKYHTTIPSADCVFTREVFIGPSSETFILCEKVGEKISVQRVSYLLLERDTNTANWFVLNAAPQGESCIDPNHVTGHDLLTEVKICSVTNFFNDGTITHFNDDYNVDVYADGIVILSGNYNGKGRLVGMDLRVLMKEDQIFEKQTLTIAPDYVRLQFDSECGQVLVTNIHDAIYLPCDDGLYELSTVFTLNDYSGKHPEIHRRTDDILKSKDSLRYATTSESMKSVFTYINGNIVHIPIALNSEVFIPKFIVPLAPLPPAPPPPAPLPPAPPIPTYRVLLSCVPRKGTPDQNDKVYGEDEGLVYHKITVSHCGLYNHTRLDNLFRHVKDPTYEWTEDEASGNVNFEDTLHHFNQNRPNFAQDPKKAKLTQQRDLEVDLLTIDNDPFLPTSNAATAEYVVGEYTFDELAQIVPFGFLSDNNDGGFQIQNPCYKHHHEHTQNKNNFKQTRVTRFFPGACSGNTCAPFTAAVGLSHTDNAYSHIEEYNLLNLLQLNQSRSHTEPDTTITYVIQMKYDTPYEGFQTWDAPALDSDKICYNFLYISMIPHASLYKDTPTAEYRYYLNNLRYWGSLQYPSDYYQQPKDIQDHQTRRRSLLSINNEEYTLHLSPETSTTDILALHDQQTAKTTLYRVTMNASGFPDVSDEIFTFQTTITDINMFAYNSIMHTVGFWENRLTVYNVDTSNVVCSQYYTTEPIIIQVDGEFIVNTYDAYGHWIAIAVSTCESMERDLDIDASETLQDVFMITDHANQTDGVMMVKTDGRLFTYYSKQSTDVASPVSRRRHLLQADENDSDPLYNVLEPKLFHKDNFATRLHTVFGQARQFIFLPLIQMGDHLRDTFQDDYPTLSRTSRHLVRTVAYLINSVTVLFSETIRSISSGELVESSKITDEFTFLFVELKALGSAPDMIYDLTSYLFPKSMGGGASAVCGRTEYVNMMIPNGLKSYHFTWETCNNPIVQSVRCPFGQDELALCNMTYAPEHTFNTNSICTITDTFTSVIHSIIDTVQVVVNIVISDLIGVVNCIEDIVLDPHSFRYNSVCTTSDTITQLKSVLNVVQCSMFNTLSRASGALPNFLSWISFTFYEIAGRERQIKPPAFLPVDCPGIGSIETCSEIGYGGIKNRTTIRETSLNHSIFYVMNHPICMYNMTADACDYACEFFKSETMCLDSSSAAFDGYCMWVSGNCKTNYTAIAESFTKGLPVTHQMFPIDAGMHTLAASVFGGIPVYAVQALEQVMDIVISPLSDAASAHSDARIHMFEGFMVGSTDVIEIRILFAVLGNIILYLRDVLISILMFIRGFVLAIGHTSHTIVHKFDKFEQVIIKLVSLIEALYVSLTDALVELTKDTIEFVVRVLAAFGAGISKDGFASLAASLYKIVKEYAELVIELLRHMFVNSELGHAVQVVVKDTCGAIDDVSRVVYQGIRVSYCDILATHIIAGKSILNLAGKHKPEWCSSDNTYKSFKDRCNFTLPEGDGTDFSYEASVCSSDTSACKQCVARTASECNVIGYANSTDASPDSWAAACPCESCSTGFHCDTATGLCVCGAERSILLKDDFKHDTYSYCKGASGQYPANVGEAKQCLMQDPTLYDGFCKVVDASGYDFTAGECETRLKEVANYVGVTHPQKSHVFKNELLCRSVCGNDESNNQNELVFNATAGGNSQAICVLGAYRHMNNTCTIYQSSREARSSFGERALGWDPVPVSDACTMHSECSASSVCTSSSGLIIDTVECGACSERTDDLVTRVYGCDAVERRCTCGVGPHTTKSIYTQHVQAMSLYDFSDFDLFLDPREWRGNSFCDRLVRAYIPDIMSNTSTADVGPVAALEVRRCMELRAAAFAVRSQLGLYTIPLNLAYDTQSQLLFAYDVVRALGTSLTMPGNLASRDARHDFFVSAGVETQLGEYVYQSTSALAELVTSTLNLNGTIYGIARMAEDMSGEDMTESAERLSRDVSEIKAMLPRTDLTSLGEVFGIASELIAMYAEERALQGDTPALPPPRASPVPAVLVTEPQRRRLLENAIDVAEDVVTTRTCPIVGEVIDRVVMAANRSIGYYETQFQVYSVCRFTNAFNVLLPEYDPRESIHNCSNGTLQPFSFVSAVFDALKSVDPLAIGEHASESSTNVTGVYRHIHRAFDFFSLFSFKQAALYWLDYIRDETRLDHFNDYLICEMDPIYGGRHVNHVADALVKTAVLFIAVMLLNPLPTSLTIISFPFQLLLVYMTFLWVAYDFHPGCFTTFSTFFVAAPVTLADDLYDVVDAFVLPPTLQWTGTDRSSTGHLSANGDLDVCLDLFRDGIDNFVYVLRRASGDTEWSLAHFFEFEPFRHAVKTFKDLRLAPLDLYEHCFFLTSINLIPGLALFVIAIRVLIRLLSAILTITFAATALVLNTIS